MKEMFITIVLNQLHRLRQKRIILIGFNNMKQERFQSLKQKTYC